jgi:hypothetical protein
MRNTPVSSCAPGARVASTAVAVDASGGSGGTFKGVVLDQLPNTVSVSFEDIFSHEVIAAMSEKVPVFLLVS